MFLPSFQMLTLFSLISLIMVDPENSLKISFWHFTFNIILALVALVAPRQILVIVENSLPFKTSLIGVLSFTLFQSVPEFILCFFDILVHYVELIYAIFEIMQFINLTFLITRVLKRKIDINKKDAIIQPQVIGFLNDREVFPFVEWSLI